MSARTRVDCLIPILSHSWVVLFPQTPSPPPPALCAGGEEERLRFCSQFSVMIVPGVHVSELLRFEAFMNRNASLFSDRYIVTI